MSRAMRKCVLCHMQTTKAQISLCTAQSDQLLCCLLRREYNISRFYSRNFKTLASFCGCAGRFVSGLVRNSRRHILSCRGSYNNWKKKRKCSICSGKGSKTASTVTHILRSIFPLSYWFSRGFTKGTCNFNWIEFLIVLREKKNHLP